MMKSKSRCRIVLPERLTLSLVTEGPTSGGWEWDTGAEEVVLEATSPIIHAEPAALAALAAWAHHHRSQGRTLRIDDSLKSPYTWNYGILHALNGSASTLAPTANYLPPTVVSNPEAHPALFSRLTPLLHSLPPKKKDVLEHCLAEMLRNVYEHADSRHGAYVCCSHFPNADRLSLAVVDTGQGIPKTIKNGFGQHLPDEQAIEMATQPFTSGATASRENNAGMGLFIARVTTRDTGGLFTLASGTGFVKGGSEESVVPGKLRSDWRGTIVAMTFRPSMSEVAWTRTDALIEARLKDRKTQPVSWGPPPAGVRLVTINPIVTGLIEDKEKAKRLRDQELLPDLMEGKPVGIDLRSARLITHSFIHALLYHPFSVLGERSRSLIHVQCDERRVKDIIRVVGWYADKGRKPDESTPAPIDSEQVE